MYGKYIWDNDKANIFLNNLQSEGVKQQLNNITDSINQAASNEEIDVSVNSFTNLLGAIAEAFFEDIYGSQNTKSTKSNFIYNAECEFKKLVFLDMLNKYRADKTDANRINMVRARTEFKAEVRLFKRELDRAKTKRLVDSKYRNAKEYWKLLQETANISTGMTKSISANRFAEYFKAINNPDDAFFQPDEEVIYFQERFLDSEIQVMFSELDVEITRKEILKSIKQLKNGKSGGPDQLLNDFLFMINMCYYHVYIHVLINYYDRLFSKLLG